MVSRPELDAADEAVRDLLARKPRAREMMGKMRQSDVAEVILAALEAAEKARLGPHQ